MLAYINHVGKASHVYYIDNMTDTKNLLANASSQCPFCPFLSHFCHQYPEKNPVLA
jgi:hypothetical protein